MQRLVKETIEKLSCIKISKRNSTIKVGKRNKKNYPAIMVNKRNSATKDDVEKIDIEGRETWKNLNNSEKFSLVKGI